MDEFSGRAAFVTGAASGIGLAMAESLASENVRIALADIDAEALARAAAMLREKGAQVVEIMLDVADEGGWSRAVDEAETAVGPISILFNNAGISVAGDDVDAIAPSVRDHCLGVNLTGAFLGCATIVPRMKERANGGHVVNTASMSGLVATPRLGVYVASKFALVGLSETLAEELAPHAIGVSILCPGPVRSQLWRTSRRIQGLEDIDTPPTMAATVGSASPQALDPALVGRLVLDAMRDNQLYIVTHPALWPGVADRFARVEAGFDWASRRLIEIQE